MTKRHLWLIAVAVLLVVATVSLAACGSSTTTTTAAAMAGAATTAASPTTTAGSAVDAAALYAQYCAGCHNNVPNVSADTAKSTIESGRNSMPSFADKMTADQITALATWVANGGK